jgi:hypothetical protein
LPIVTHEIAELEKFFAIIVKKFKVVSFVPGNHDFWLVKGDKTSKDSVAKFEQMLALCKQYGVQTAPYLFEDELRSSKVWLVPLFSWYNEAFDDDESTKGERIRREMWCDYMHCKWPERVIEEDTETPSTPTGSPELFFLQRNEPSIEAVLASTAPDAMIISFSHFLPRRECFPRKDDLPEYRRFLPKVIGSWRLEEQIRRLKSHIHVFGHTHIPWNMMIDGVQYVQMCLKYPKERVEKPHESFEALEEMCIFDSTVPSREDMFNLIEQKKSLRLKRQRDSASSS